MRDGLLEACKEVQLAMQGIRGRLGPLASDIHSRVANQAKSDRTGAPSVNPVEVTPAAIADASTELAQSVA
jgi:hypothetical protein